MGARGTVGNDGGKEHMGCSRKEVQIIFFFAGVVSYSWLPIHSSLSLEACVSCLKKVLTFD